MAKPFVSVITPVSRPENLGKVSASLAFLEPWVEYQWYPILDTGGPDVGGGRKRNIGIRLAISDHPAGWLYQLDDDNIISPSFGKALAGVILEKPDADVIIYSHILRSDGLPYSSHGLDRFEDVRVGKIDAGQFVVRAEFVREIPWGENDYCADGAYITSVLARGAKVTFTTEAFVWYNGLS